MQCKPLSRFLWRLASVLCLAAGVATTAFGQAYPSKPIFIKVAFPAGGPADVSIRAASIVLQRNLKQSILSDNVPGANGSIGAMTALRAAPDGYTLLGTTGIDFLVAPTTVASAKYQPEEFKLIGVVGISDFVLVSSPAHNFKSADELIAYAKKPGNKELSIAHWGPGSAPHLVAADFQAHTGVHFLEVPYKGAAPTTVDVAGGQVDLTFVPLGGSTLSMIQSGKLRAIAVASSKRNPALPQVPTIGESALVHSFDYSLWSAVLALPNTPQAVVDRLNSALNEWIVSPENLERTTTNASRKLDPMTPAQAGAFLKSEHEKYLRIARTLKLQPQ